MRANVNIYDILKSNISKDNKILYHNKTSMDMSVNEFQLLTSTCCDKKDQPLNIDITKDMYTGCYGLALNSFLVPDSSVFQIN